MEGLKLSDRVWKVFNFTEIFKIVDGYYNKKPPVSEKGNIPFLGATQYNNGITAFITNEKILEYDKIGNISKDGIDKRIFKGNCIAITNNGSVGNAYYQVANFTCSHDITPVYLLNFELNREIAMFLIPSLLKAGESFEYAKKWRPKRMRKSKLLLPIDHRGNVDFKFMEEFIKQKEAKLKREIVDYYAEKALDLIIETQSLNNTDWKEFLFSEIFEKVQRGKRLTKNNQTEGSTPYVSSTALNNGVDNFISNNHGVRGFDNCLSIANSGSVGATFFHNYKFIASDHVTALHLAQPNKYIYLFLSSIIKRLEEKYSFNREINDARIKREKIILPTTSDGLPDWQFMEDFMKKIEQDKIQTILSYYRHGANALLVERERERERVSRYSDYFGNWQEFEIGKICKIKSGVRLIKSDQQIGNLPFIGASDSNNGITEFVSNNNESYDRNILGVNYNGSVVENFYHPYPAIFSDDVKRLELNIRANKYHYLFLKTAILKQKNKFQYGYKFNASRMCKQKILLPVNKENELDWNNMERYMKENEQLQLITVLNYFTK